MQILNAPPPKSNQAAPLTARPAVDLSTFSPVEAGGVPGGDPAKDQPPFVSGKLANGDLWIVTDVNGDFYISAPWKLPQGLRLSEARGVEGALVQWLSKGQPLEGREVVQYLQQQLRKGLDQLQPPPTPPTGPALSAADTFAG